jgi:SAM-dependent methyltransferase
MQPFNENKPACLSLEILKVLAKTSPDRGLRGETLAQAVVNLSRLFTTARSSLTPRYLDDPGHAAGYLSYFLPVNLSKIQGLLNELMGDNSQETLDRPMAVLDLGCGPGTGSLALLDWLWHRSPERAKSLSVLAADISETSLRDTERLWKAYCQEVGISGANLRCVEGNLEHPLNDQPSGRASCGGWATSAVSLDARHHHDR